MYIEVGMVVVVLDLLSIIIVDTCSSNSKSLGSGNIDLDDSSHGMSGIWFSPAKYLKGWKNEKKLLAKLSGAA